MNYADILKKKAKEWDCKNLMNSVYEVVGERIPFSSPLMNWFTYGGIPRNRLIEIYGDYGSGKTTTSLDLCKNAYQLFESEYNKQIEQLQQKLSSGDRDAEDELEELQELGPKKVLYVDLEHSFDVKWAETLGVDLSKLDVMQPPSVIGEDILQTVRDLISTGEVGMIVLDSVPSITPETVLKKKVGEKTVAALAGLMTNFDILIIPLLKRYKCTLILINQIRDNMANPYEVNTPGGKANKFYSSMRFHMRKGKPVDYLGNELPMNAENPAGCLIHARLTKDKTAPNDRNMGTYYLMFQSGIRPDFDYATLALTKYNLIKKSAGWYGFIDPETGEVLMNAETGKPVKVNGLGKVYDYLNANVEYYNKLKNFILDDINGADKDEPEEAD